MELLLILFVLGVITLVGHTIWVVLAAFFRLLTGDAPGEPSAPRREAECAGCGHPLRPTASVCPVCRLKRDGRTARQLGELSGAIDQVRALAERAEIDPAVAEQVVQLLRARRRELLGEAPPPAPRPAASTVPVAPGAEGVRLSPAVHTPLHVRDEILDVIPVEPMPLPPIAVAAEEPAPSPPAPLPQPVAARRTLGELLSGFMEARNILWGELVGGLLIVGCSIALVLTLWQTLQTIPYFPFLLFTALTGALFAAGEYTLHHWKLATTSRGLLLISLLLVPLNLLILADPAARGNAPLGVAVDLLVGVAAVAGFVLVVRWSGGDLIGTNQLTGPIDRRWLLAAGVVAPPALLLFGPALGVDATGPMAQAFPILAATSVGCFVVASLAVVAGLGGYGRRVIHLRGTQAQALLTFLGASLFAVLASLGYLLARVSVVADGLHALAIPVVLMGVPSCLFGLLLAQRMAAGESGGYRAAGTALLLGGTGLMLLGAGLAWPAAGALLVALLLAGLLQTSAGQLFRVPWLLGTGTAVLLFAGLVGFHLATGHVGADRAAGAGPLIEALASAPSAVVLVVAALLLQLPGAWLQRRGESSLAWAIDGVGLGAVVVALLLATRDGLTFPASAAAVHAAATGALLLLAARRTDELLPQSAGAVFVIGTLWALHAALPGQPEWWGVVLAGEALALALVQAACAWGGVVRHARASGAAALLAGAIGAGFALVPAEAIYQYHLTGTLTLLSAALLVPALARRGPWLFTAFQGGVTLAMLAGMTALAATRGWVGELPQVHAYGIALAALAAVWVMVRRGLDARPGWERLARPFTPGLDEMTMGVSVLGLVLLAGVGASLGVQAEWGIAAEEAIAERFAGPASWLWLLVAVVAPVGMLVRPGRDEQPRRRGALFCLMLLGVAGALLQATRHADELATATALRWDLATAFLLGAMALWGRDGLERLAPQVRLVGAPVQTPLVGLLSVLAVIVLLMTAILVGQGFAGVVLAGPLPTSVFARMGTLAASLGPVILVIVALVGSALRERSPSCALAAQLLAGLSTFGGLLLGLKQAGVPLVEEHYLLAGLLAAAVLAVAGASWMAGRRRIGDNALLGIAAQLGLAVAFLAAVFLVSPLLSTSGTGSGGPLRLSTCGVGALALLLAAATAWWHAAVFTPRYRIDVAGFTGLTGGILLCAVGDALVRQHPFPVLTVVWALLGLLFVLAGSLLPLRPRQWGRLLPARRMRRWALVLIVVQMVVVVRARLLPEDLRFIGEAAAGTMMAALVAGAVALWYRRGEFVTLSGLLGTLALVLLDLPELARLAGYPALAPQPATSWLSVALGLALTAAFWSAIRVTDPVATRRRTRWLALPYPPGATVVAVVVFLGLVTLAVLGDAAGEAGLAFGAVGPATALAIGLALALALWGGRIDFGLPCLYLLGLGTIGLAIHATGPAPQQMAWIAPLGLAGQVTLASLTALLWSGLWQPQTAEPGRFQLAHPLVPDPVWRWLLPAQIVLGTLALLLAASASVQDLPLLQRLAGPATALLLLGATLALGRVAPTAWREPVQLIGLGLAPALLGLLAWALPDPAAPAPWLERTAWLFAGLTLSGLLGLELLPRWRAGGQLALAVTGIAGIVLLALLGEMIPAFAPALKRTPLSGWAIAAVVAAIAGLMAGLVRLALRSQRDPLALSERGRTAYVYLAEVLLLLLFVHLRLNVPELFGGFFARYWTFLVLFTAFVGVGLGEWFDRQGMRVLAGPLHRTGILLPLVPVLVFWARPPAALLAFADGHAPGLVPLLETLRKVPLRYDVYSLVWFVTSMLYLFVALSRRSTRWAIVAAVAANAGFWAVLAHVGVGFLVHPQAWLIPLAVIVLLAEYLHRDELDARLAETLRYLGVTLIYVASTADLFIAGLGNSAWLPVLLATLCVAGILVGMLFRIRAFLFLGLGFLLLDVLSMIWYAAVDRAHTWLWWAAGIVLGTAILALFAVFEKRKNDVLAFLDELKQWD